MPVPPTILCTHGRRARTARVGSNRPIILARHCAPAKISSPAEKSNSGLALAGVGVGAKAAPRASLRMARVSEGSTGAVTRLLQARWRARRPEIAELHGAGWRARACELARAGERMCSATLPRGFLGVSHDVVAAFERGEWHEESPRTQKVHAHEQRLVRFTYSPWCTR